MGADPVTGALLGVGAATQLGGQMANLFGGGRTSTVFIPPEVREAFMSGAAGARQGLDAIPQLGFGPVGEAFAESAGRIDELDAPETTVDADDLSRDIVEAAEELAFPQRARRAREFRETAGAFGPSQARSQVRAGQLAEAENRQAAILANLMPQLRAEEFQQDLQQLNAALGLEQARQSTALTPFQVSTQARQGFINQLMGAGQGYGTPQETVPGISPVAAALQGFGGAISDVPMTAALIDRYRRGGATGGGVNQPNNIR